MNFVLFYHNKKASSGDYKVITITQVDTSTGLLSPIAEYAAIIHELCPNTLIAVDGVCSVGAEDLRMNEWGIDAALTCSQKALGVPPGLLVAVFSNKAISVVKTRKTPVPAYYVSLLNWMPIVEAYRARKPSYFATPPVQLIFALRTALQTRVLPNGGVRSRIAENAAAAKAFRAAISALGLHLLVDAHPNLAANTLSAIRFPPKVEGPPFLAALKKHGVIAAGGLHKEIKTQYFRIGHMGVSIQKPDHLRIVITAIEKALAEQGYSFPENAGLHAFESSWK